MVRGPMLRAVMNRKLRLTGEEPTLSEDRSCVILKNFTLGEGATKGVWTLQSKASVKIVDRLIFVRPNPTLYKEGTVQYCPVISPMDEAQPVVVTFKPNNKEFDVATLDYFVELYIGD